MNVIINPAYLDGRINAISSKSHAHRALICAALADTQSHVVCSDVSDDITATAECLTALGADVSRNPDGFAVHPVTDDKPDNRITLPCKESGSTFRFLLPVTGALGRSAVFPLEGRLPDRPLSPLYEQLAAHGCTMSAQGSKEFCIDGQLTSGQYTLSGDVSSQFISGLLLALPLIGGDSEVKLTGKIESLPYINLTREQLKQFYITSEFAGNTYYIPGNQKYLSPGKVVVEGDWSNAAFWLTAGALSNGSITCTGLNLSSSQGDRMIVDILKQFGANAETGNDSITVFGGSKLSGIELDVSDIPDLVPIVSVIGAVAGGITYIKNAKRLRAKESDRLSSVTAMLSTLGADIQENPDSLIISGGKKLNGGTVSSYGDHRIAMAAAIAATVCSSSVTIQGADAVGKSYPKFFEDFKILGGKAE